MDAAAEKEGVIMPRLRFRDVVLRGALYGTAATLIPAVVSVTAGAYTWHEHRTTFLGAITLVSLGVSVLFWAVGGFFWACSSGDIRRLRDFRTVSGRSGGVLIWGAAYVRAGAFTLTIGALTWLLTALIDASQGIGWLYGRY